MAYRSPHMVHCKPAPQQKIRSFALNPTVACQSLWVAAVDQIPCNRCPIAFKTIHCNVDGLTAEAMSGKLCVDIGRPIAAIGTIAYE